MVNCGLFQVAAKSLALHLLVDFSLDHLLLTVDPDQKLINKIGMMGEHERQAQVPPLAKHNTQLRSSSKFVSSVASSSRDELIAEDEPSLGMTLTNKMEYNRVNCLLRKSAQKLLSCYSKPRTL
ncbi:hypothetical protein Tco_0650736 [Tanacetum coccineum]